MAGMGRKLPLAIALRAGEGAASLTSNYRVALSAVFNEVHVTTETALVTETLKSYESGEAFKKGRGRERITCDAVVYKEQHFRRQECALVGHSTPLGTHLKAAILSLSWVLTGSSPWDESLSL